MASGMRLLPKVLVLLSLLGPVAVGLTLLYFSATQRYGGPQLAAWVEENRTVVQVLVQISSTILGALQVYTLVKVIRFWVNTRLLGSSFTLDSIKLLQAVTATKLDFELPGRFLAALALFVAAVQIPSAIWVGALTPVLTTTQVTDATFMIPAYSEAKKAYFAQDCAPTQNCGSLVSGNTSELGTFSYIPWKTKAGLLLNSILQASSRNNSAARHAKLDNTGYTFSGRSYGVAATVGLADIPAGGSTRRNHDRGGVASFSYAEHGYLSRVACAYNASSNLSISELGAIATPGGAFAPVAYWAGGSLPNGPWLGFPVFSSLDNGSIVAIAAVRSGGDDRPNDSRARYLYGLTAGCFYGGLSGVQCEATFAPSAFRVDVDMPTSSIRVTPDASAPPVDIDPTGAVVSNAFYAPSYLSQTLTTMYTSILGSNIAINAANVRARLGHSNDNDDDTNDDDDDGGALIGTPQIHSSGGATAATAKNGTTNSGTTATLNQTLILTAVQESLQLLLDESLGSIAAAQSQLAADTQTVPATATLRAVRLGSPLYLYGVLATSLAVALLAATEATRTRFWETLPAYDCLDVKSAILGAAAAGRDSKEEPRTGLSGACDEWSGDASDRDVGAIRVVLAGRDPPQMRLMWA